MIVKLSMEDVKKIIGTLSLMEIESMLGYNWKHWEVDSYNGDFELIYKKPKPSEAKG